MPSGERWVIVYRFGRWRYQLRSHLIRRPFSLLYKIMKIVVQISTSINLPCEVTLGRRVRIDHFGGVIVSGDTVIGDDVVIRNGVTIGLCRTGVRGAPVIGNRVDIGRVRKSWALLRSATMSRSAPRLSC